MPDCITLFRYRNGSGIDSSFQSGTGWKGCRAVRCSGSQYSIAEMRPHPTILQLQIRRLRQLRPDPGSILNSVLEPELQEAATFWQSRSRNAMRRWQLRPDPYSILNSVIEQEQQGAASFWGTRSSIAMRLEL
jgi:hypothetical protein